MFTNYDNAYDYELVTGENEYFKIYDSEFVITSGDSIRVNFAGDKDNGDWHFGFSRISGDEISQNITGTGDAIKILSTVIKMIIHVATTEDVRFMMFRAGAESVREKLFERIFRKLSHIYGYGVRVQTSDSGSTICVVKEVVYETL
jgi:hypothetical protein